MSSKKLSWLANKTPNSNYQNNTRRRYGMPCSAKMNPRTVQLCLASFDYANIYKAKLQPIYLLFAHYLCRMLRTRRTVQT